MNWFNTTRKGYKYDRRIFISGFVITVILALSLMYAYNFDFSPKAYFKCDSYKCDNPFYLRQECPNTQEYSWCSYPTLERGEYGQSPPKNPLFRFYGYIALFLLVFAFVLNHYAHNKGRKFDLEIRISDKKRISLLDLKLGGDDDRRE